jgi:hypothetical protein
VAVSTVAWDDLRQEFIWDGALRDVYVLETAIDDWECVIGGLAGESRVAASAITPSSLEGFKSVREIFQFVAATDLAPTLHVNWLGIDINCHFFCDWEIEFDIDPRQINDEQHLDALVNFMNYLWERTRKEVILTWENDKDAWFIRVDAPTGLIHWRRLGEYSA